MKKLLLILLLLPVFALGQSETHDIITYDTILTTGLSNAYRCRVSRPRNLFTAGHADNAPRAAIITMPGQGEMGTDYSKLRTSGPHYWLYRKSNLAIDSALGWDGRVVLSNGIHYPILISIISTTTFPSALDNYTVLNFFINNYHIKPGAVHLAGLSQGAFTWSSMIAYEQTAGAETGMKVVTSLTLLQGTASELPNPYQTWSRGYVAFGVWAKKYNGKLFALEGTNDERDIDRATISANDSVPGSAYFAEENFGGGNHCCWNSMYDPYKTDFQNFSPYGANITTGGFPTKINTPGTYKNGDNLFTWMLRQGDTSLSALETPPNTVTKMSISEYTRAQLHSDSVVRSPKFNSTAGRVLMSALDAGGKKVIDVAPGFNTHIMLAADGTVYEGVANTTTSNQVLTDTTGAAFNDVIAIYGYYFGRIAIKSDSSMWYFGKNEYNFPGSSTAVYRPFKISGSLKVKKVTMGYVIQALTTNGQLWFWTDGGGLTPTQKTLVRPAVDIFGSHHNWQGCIIPDVTGSQTMGYPYIYGSEFSFWGGNTSYAQPTSVKTLWGVTQPIKVIVSSDNVTSYIDSSGRAFAIGDNTMGEIGNGIEYVNRYTYPTPYQWTFTKGENYTGAPAIQIGAGTVWKNMWRGNALSYYYWMQDVNDSTYSGGANKSYAVNDKISLEEAAYRNGLDVTTPTMSSPLAFNAQPYHFTISSANAGSDKTVSGTSTTLSGTATPIQLIASGTVYNGQPNISPTIASYLWTKVSGTGGTITAPTSASTAVTGLTPGVYVYRFTATDTKGGTMSDTITVTVDADVPPAEPGHILSVRKGAKIEFKK